MRRERANDDPVALSVRLNDLGISPEVAAVVKRELEALGSIPIRANDRVMGTILTDPDDDLSLFRALYRYIPAKPRDFELPDARPIDTVEDLALHLQALRDKYGWKDPHSPGGGYASTSVSIC